MDSSVHEQPEGVKNLMNVVFNRARMEGFVVFDYYPFYSKLRVDDDDYV